jgi:hypothetical protein
MMPIDPTIAAFDMMRSASVQELLSAIARGMTIEAMVQVAIVLFGVGALFFQYADCPRQRHLAPWLGLAGQPAWIYAAYTSHQWGMLLVTVAYTFGWMRGIWKNIQVSRKS